MKIKCKECSELFKPINGNQKFCNVKCKSMHHNSKVKKDKLPIKECLTCGEEFQPRNKLQNNCSSKCPDISNKKIWNSKKKFNNGFGIANCSMCGIEFEKTSAISKYCSSSCRSKYHRELAKFKKEKEDIKNNIYTTDIEDFVYELVNRGLHAKMNNISCGYKYNSINESLRHNISHRDNYSCRVCNNDTNLEIHHIVKTIHGGDNSNNNLITLCKSCHRAIDTLDYEHASKKCINNFIKNHDNKRHTRKSSEVMLNDCYSQISKLYFELKDYDMDKTELIKSLDYMMDMIENNKAD